MTIDDPLPFVERALQINIHPGDVPHATLILPHQLRVWSSQVERVHVTVDTPQMDSDRRRLHTMLDEMQANYPQLHVDIVNDSQNARQQVCRQFFSQSSSYPDTAYDGSPFHSYFHGILCANARYVLHMNSDMLFGGASQTWLDEAIGLLKSEPDALCIAPFPGPPTPRGDIDLSRHVIASNTGNIPTPRKLPTRTPTWRHATVSTRVFLIDMERFSKRIGALELLRPDWKRRLRSYAYNRQPLTLPIEQVLTDAMWRNGTFRLDFLGKDKGMYALHPPHRSPEFHAALPDLITRVEKGQIPQGQFGDGEINAAMQDWTSALAARSKSRRYARALRHLITANYRRFSRS